MRSTTSPEEPTTVAGINEGRIVAITGAGGGVGRSHALAFAQTGAKVVVNDLGGARDGSGGDAGPAETVAAEIRAAGGEAVANTDNIATQAGADNLIRQAIETYGDVHVVVNNAGILRDKMLVNMSESDWDAVVAVHLKGTFGPMQAAAKHWREQTKAGREVQASVINTSSASGIFGNVGQANYGAAKAGIASLTIIAAMELGRYGVRVNAISPTALTRMTEGLEGLTQLMNERGGPEALSPDNISPVVTYLGSPISAPITGRVFGAWGGRVTVMEGWTNGPYAETEGRWDPEALADVIPDLVAKAAPNSLMNGTRPAAQ
jgi:NAD(P)-dependent dehydrogenase (short-subunit alcohol dehydrogenase family)